MKIRRLQHQDRIRILQIWKECFGDTDAFLDVYFTEAASIENGYGLIDNGVLVSDLFTLDFYAKIAGNKYRTDFLAGCATVKSARHKNFMRELIRYSLRAMAGKNSTYTFLHPFLHEFYRKFGYETIAFVDSFCNIDDALNKSFITINKIQDTPLTLLLNSYKHYINSYDNCFLRDERRFSAWLNLLFADGGALSIADSADYLSYALYYDYDDNSREIFELVLNDETALPTLTACNKVSKVGFFLPSKNNFKTKKNKEFTMMRILSPIRALQNCKLNVKDNFVIYIDDPFLQCEYNLLVGTDKNHCIVKKTNAAADISVDINLLAQIVTGTYPENAHPLIQEIFPRRTSCFFETY